MVLLIFSFSNGNFPKSVPFPLAQKVNGEPFSVLGWMKSPLPMHCRDFLEKGTSKFVLLMFSKDKTIARLAKQSVTNTFPFGYHERNGALKSSGPLPNVPVSVHVFPVFSSSMCRKASGLRSNQINLSSMASNSPGMEVSKSVFTNIGSMETLSMSFSSLQEENDKSIREKQIRSVFFAFLI